MKNFDIIKKYHEGKLSKTELASFNQELNNNPTFKSEVEDYLLLLNGLEAIKINEFEMQLKDWSKDFSLQPVEVKKEKTKITWYKSAFAIAASIGILLLGLYLWNISADNDLSNFQETAYIPIFETEKTTFNQFTTLLLAQNDFNNQNFSACINRLNEFEERDSLFIPAQLLKGHAAFKNGAYEQSIQILNSLLTNPKTKDFKEINVENVEWTILLASLKKYLIHKSPIEKTKLLAATNSFLQRANPADTYFEKAQELKKLLD